MNAKGSLSASAAAGLPSTALRTKVAMPASSGDAGEAGQWAADGTRFAIYVEGTGWIFYGTGAGGGDVVAANNGSDFPSPSTFRTNLSMFSKDEVNARRNGLAPAQALVFNGTAGCTVTIPAFGTSGFTVAAVINVRSLAANFLICDGNTGLLFYVMTDGALRIINRNTSATIYTSAAGVITTGTTYAVAYARGSMYLNGVLLGTATDTSDYAGAIELIGAANAGTGYANGTLRVWSYNRTLSDGEVAALYATGRPDGSDFGASGQPASNSTSLVTGDNSSFASDTGYWSAGGSAVISGGALSCPTSSDYISRGSVLTIGKKYRVTAGTITGQMQVSDTVNAAVALVSGGSVEITAAGTTLAIGTASTGTLADITVYPIGLVCAPEANAPGNGRVWNDQSGNGAHIILPASGVDWVLPSSTPNKVRGTTSTNGNQQMLAANCLPATCQITRIRARSRSGTPTITLGTASGGAQLVASVALSTTWKDLTIALTGGIVSAAASVWVGSNSTDVVEVDITQEPLGF